MSLLFPAYLAGLLGLALPWLLHRFSDQQAPEQSFPSARFLEAATPPVSRTRQLKYLALFTLRVLSLLLLCFLFAQPWLNREISTAAVSQHHLIAVDQSLSMRTTGRWSAAISRTREIIDSLPAGDTVEILGVDSGVRRFGRAEESKAVQLQELTNRQPGFLASDYGAVMQGINNIASESDIAVKLWLITDVQQSAVPAQLNALYAPQLAELVVESVVSEPQSNVHLQASALSSDGVNLQINVQLMASESLPAATASEPSTEIAKTSLSGRSMTVQLFSEGRLLLEQQVTLSPGKLQTLVFDRLVMPATRNPVFTVALADADDLADDDRVDIVVQTANPMSVALLATDRGVSESASVFLATALETDGMAQVQVVTGGSERVPADVQHIMTGRVLARDIDQDILQFVDSGANALVFSSAPAPVLPDIDPMNLSNITGSPMGLSDDSHPLELDKLDWSGVRFFDVPALTLAKGDRVLLQTNQQEPVLIEKITPRGRLLVLNDRLDGVSSNLPLQPAFVSLMQSILGYFDASTAFPDQLVAGNRLLLPARVQLLDPNDQPLLTLDESAQSRAIELDEPGLYKIIGVRGEHVLQLVLDSREADIGTMDEAELSAWQNRYSTPGATDVAAPGVLLDDRFDSVTSSRTMSVVEAARLLVWRFVLPLLLIALIVESALANRRLDVRRDGT